MIKNKKKPQKRRRGAPNESRERSQYVRCYKCESNNSKRNQGKAINTTLTNDDLAQIIKVGSQLMMRIGSLWLSLLEL